MLTGGGYLSHMRHGIVSGLFVVFVVLGPDVETAS